MQKKNTLFNQLKHRVLSETSEDCWIWHGSISSRGYGQLGKDRKMLMAHRVAYTLRYGPIPDGLQIDHLCRVSACYNPDHLEAVTQSVNLRRGIFPNMLKTHCPQGHSYSGDNLVIIRYGYRRCRLCHNLAGKRRWARGQTPKQLRTLALVAR